MGTPGEYEVRFYLKNGYTGTSSPGSRIYSVEVEGQAFAELTDIDLVDEYAPSRDRYDETRILEIIAD